MKRGAFWILALLVFLPLAAAPWPGSKKQEPDPARPALRLSASKRHGYPPLRVILSAHLTNVEPGDANFCHAAIEWESTRPGGIVTRSREAPACLHPPEKVEITSSYTRVVTLETGIYSYRAILHLRDGSILYSTSVDVTVLSR